MERFKTLAASTLNGGIDASQTSITLVSAASFSTSGNFRIIIDSEIMLVTGVAGNVFTVTRGIEGTTGAIHSNGAAVRDILTAGSLQQFRIDNAPDSTITAEKSGRLAFVDPFMVHDRGSTLHRREFLYKMTPPVLANFSWVNQGSATADNTNGFLYLKSPGTTTNNVVLLEQAAPATPYNIYSYVLTNRSPVNFLAAGICHRENATGKIEAVCFTHAFGLAFEIMRWNSATSHNSTPFSTLHNNYGQNVPWLRMENTGSALRYYVSPDGYMWRKLWETTLTAFFTTAPDRVALYLATASTTAHVIDAAYLHWKT